MSYVTKAGEIVTYALVATVSIPSKTESGGIAAQIVDSAKSASIVLEREKLELFEKLLEGYIESLKRKCEVDHMFDNIQETVHEIERIQPLVMQIRGLLGKEIEKSRMVPR